MKPIQEIIENTIYNPYTQTGSALTLISKCRTGSLGHHKVECNECQHKTYRANSCRNRNCPICGKKKQHEWINRMKSMVLNCKYYHCVATVPDTLYQIILYNQAVMYDMMLKASAETIIELCEDKKYLGAKVGVIEMLHTWNQKIGYHPHAHMLVSAGGVDKSGKWKEKEDFLVPVKVLSKKYKGKFLSMLEKNKAKIKLDGKLEKYREKEEWNKLINELYKKEFVTYIKEPYNNADTVIEYFGRYVSHVAISNSRIIDFDGEKVTYKYKDRKDGNKEKTETITAEEFVKRFSLHILPKRFRKIRGYGIFSNRNLHERLEKIRVKLKVIKNREKLELKLDNICELRCEKCGSKNVVVSYKIDNLIIIRRPKLE